MKYYCRLCHLRPQQKDNVLLCNECHALLYISNNQNYHIRCNPPLEIDEKTKNIIGTLFYWKFDHLCFIKFTRICYNSII